MSILLALLIGIAVGAAVGFWFQRNADYLLFDILLGIIGAILGLALVFLARPDQTTALFSVSGTVGSLIGAVVGVALYQVVLRIPKKKKGSL